MRHPVLVLNAGSSSLKFSVYDTRDDRSLDAGVHVVTDLLPDVPRGSVVSNPVKARRGDAPRGGLAARRRSA